MQTICRTCQRVFGPSQRTCPEHLGFLKLHSLVGDVLRGRYEVTETIGNGFQSLVSRGRDSELGYDVAVKALLLDPDAFRFAATRFEKEAHAYAALTDQRFPRLFTRDVLEDGRPYFVYEFISGEGLDSVLRSEGRLLAPRAVRIAMEVAAAMQEAHRLGFLHQDISPGNLMRLMDATGTEQIKIIDFGIQRATAGEPDEVARSRRPVGHPPTMSPEQWLHERVGPATDIFSLGATLYELLTGVPPFGDGDWQDVRQRTLHEAPPPMRDALVHREAPVHLTFGLEELVVAMLGKEPAQRPESMLEVHLGLRRILKELEPETVPYERYLQSVAVPALSVSPQPANDDELAGPGDALLPRPGGTPDDDERRVPAPRQARRPWPAMERSAGPQVVAPDDPLARYIVEVSLIEPECTPTTFGPAEPQAAPSEPDADSGQVDTSPGIVRRRHLDAPPLPTSEAEEIAVAAADEPSVVDALCIDDDDFEHDFDVLHEGSTLDDDPLGYEDEPTPVTAEEEPDLEVELALPVVEHWPDDAAALFAEDPPVAGVSRPEATEPDPAGEPAVLPLPCDDTPPPTAGYGARTFEWPTDTSVMRRVQRRADSRMAMVAAAMFGVIAVALWIAWMVVSIPTGAGRGPLAPLQLSGGAPPQVEASMLRSSAALLARHAPRVVGRQNPVIVRVVAAPVRAHEEAAQDRPSPRVLSIEVSATIPPADLRDLVDPAPILRRGSPAASVPAPPPVPRPGQSGAPRQGADERRTESTARAGDPRAGARTTEAVDAPVDMRLFQEF